MDFSGSPLKLKKQDHKSRHEIKQAKKTQPEPSENDPKTALMKSSIKKKYFVSCFTEKNRFAFQNASPLRINVDLTALLGVKLCAEVYYRLAGTGFTIKRNKILFPHYALDGVILTISYCKRAILAIGIN